MNLADQVMDISKNTPFQNNLSTGSCSSFSDSEDDDDSIFTNKRNCGANKELAAIFAANRILAADESKKKNIYVHQPRSKHDSGGSVESAKKSAWRKIAEKFGNKSQIKNAKGNSDEWRRCSLDVVNMTAATDAAVSEESGRHYNLKRLLSLERETKDEMPMRPRSNSDVSHFKIVSKHAETAHFTVTEPSKLADASAMCHEYFSRLTCYDAVPTVTTVIAVEKKTNVSKIFDAFCAHNATAVILWDSVTNGMVGTCHVDDLVCRLWKKARQSAIEPLFDVEGDFSRPVEEFCRSGLDVIAVPADTNLMEAARLICSTSDKQKDQCAKRLALVNEISDDVVHLLSAWDILHFFSQQMSKFHAAHTAFDRTVGAILASQQHQDHKSDVLSEDKSLKQLIGSMAENGGGAVLSRINGKQMVTTLSFVDIIQYVINTHGSWDEADATKKTLAHILRYHKKKESLVIHANTPLFLVLKDWTASMTADMPVVVVDPLTQFVLGVLEPEHLLQALLSSDSDIVEKMDCSSDDLSYATRF